MHIYSLILALWTLPAMAESSQHVQVEAFSGISAGGQSQVNVQIGARQGVVLKGDKNVLKEVNVRSHRGILHIEDLPGSTKGWPWNERSLKVEITTPLLSFVKLGGAASLKASGLQGASFEIEMSGAGEAELSGKVRLLEITMAGAGKLKALDLNADIVEIEISGAGEAEITAHKVLEADISGVGRLEYNGKPAIVKSQVSGVGFVRPRG